MAKRRFDLACRLLLVVEIDEELTQHGRGFLVNALRQATRDVLKSRSASYDLTVMAAQELRTPGTESEAAS